MTHLHSSWVLYDSVFVPDSDISDSHWRSGGWWLAENQTVRKYKPNTTQTNKHTVFLSVTLSRQNPTTSLEKS